MVVILASAGERTPCFPRARAQKESKTCRKGNQTFGKTLAGCENASCGCRWTGPESKEPIRCQCLTCLQRWLPIARRGRACEGGYRRAVIRRAAGVGLLWWSLWDLFEYPQRRRFPFLCPSSTRHPPARLWATGQRKGEA